MLPVALRGDGIAFELGHVPFTPVAVGADIDVGNPGIAVIARGKRREQPLQAVEVDRIVEARDKLGPSPLAGARQHDGIVDRTRSEDPLGRDPEFRPA